MSLKIEIVGFNKQYRNCNVAIKNIIISKRITLIVGENGSGKSTLLKAMAGFIKYKGSIIGKYTYGYFSEVLMYPEDINVYEFQNSMQLINEDKLPYEILYNNLVELNLEDKIDENIKYLSKGMKTKLGLLNCLNQKADVYLLDEPLSGIDKKSIERVKELIKSSDKTFVIATHMKSELRSIAEEVINLD